MRNPAKLAMTAAVLVGLSTVATGGGTYAAFSSVTENTGNNFNAGTVSLTDNDAGVAMFSATGMRPGDTQVGCIRVAYEGTIPGVPVRLHGANLTGGLATYLTLRVERGTLPATPPAFDSCTGFTSDTANHKGLGAGVLYDSTLAAYPTTWAAGVTDPNATWAANEAHVYRVTVTLPAAVDTAAQGLSANNVTFRWETQS